MGNRMMEEKYEPVRTYVETGIEAIRRTGIKVLDLRERYAGRDFPKDQNRFKLGGHMAELGCVHIDFVNWDGGWRLWNISVCR